LRWWTLQSRRQNYANLVTRIQGFEELRWWTLYVGNSSISSVKMDPGL